MNQWDHLRGFCGTIPALVPPIADVHSDFGLRFLNGLQTQLGYDGLTGKKHPLRVLYSVSNQSRGTQLGIGDGQGGDGRVRQVG